MIKKATLKLMTLTELRFLLSIIFSALIVVPKEEYADLDFFLSEIQDIIREKEC